MLLTRKNRPTFSRPTRSETHMVVGGRGGERITKQRTISLDHTSPYYAYSPLTIVFLSPLSCCHGTTVLFSPPSCCHRCHFVTTVISPIFFFFGHHCLVITAVLSPPSFVTTVLLSPLSFCHHRLVTTAMLSPPSFVTTVLLSPLSSCHHCLVTPAMLSPPSFVTTVLPLLFLSCCHH